MRGSCFRGHLGGTGAPFKATNCKSQQKNKINTKNQGGSGRLWVRNWHQDKGMAKKREKLKKRKGLLQRSPRWNWRPYLRTEQTGKKQK